MISSNKRIRVSGAGYHWSNMAISQSAYGVGRRSRYPAGRRGLPGPVGQQEIDPGRLNAASDSYVSHWIVTQLDRAQQPAEKVPVGRPSTNRRRAASTAA